MSTIKVEPFTVGDFIHAYNQGNRKELVFLSKTDYWRFLRELRFFNDVRDISEFGKGLTGLIASQKKILQGLDPSKGHNTFEWRAEWGVHQPLVEIISYCLMPNHYHLLLREIIPKGISKFMQKIGGGYTVYRNTTNKNGGRIFRGQYRGKTAKDEKHLQYLDVYIQVFNPFELFEGGIVGALENFDAAFQFALDYPFCSLGEVYGTRDLHIVSRDCFKCVFPNSQIYKEFCKDALITRNAREFLGKLTME